MIAIEHTFGTNKWNVKFKGITVSTVNSRIEALRKAFKICDLYENGFFEGMTEEEISKCSM